MIATLQAVGDQALDARGLPPTLASFKRDAEALLYTLSEADVSQDLEKRRLQSEWAKCVPHASTLPVVRVPSTHLTRCPCPVRRRGSEPIIDRFTAWLWSWFAWMPGAEPDSRTYLAQNDKVIAAFRKRLQQNMKRVRSLFGVTKHVTATSISGEPGHPAVAPRLRSWRVLTGGWWGALLSRELVVLVGVDARPGSGHAP